MLAVLLLDRMNSTRKKLRKPLAKPVLKPVKEETRGAVDYCRTCLATEDLIPIFFSKEGQNKRSEDLRFATGLEITVNDGLSQKICVQCIEIVNTNLQFRRTCKKAEKTLLSMAQSKPKKSMKSHKHKTHKTEDVKPDPDYLQMDTNQYNAPQGDYNYEYDLGDDFQNYDFGNMDDIEPEKPTTKKKLTTPTIFRCNTCNKEFKMKATFKAHMRFHTNYCVCESCGKRCRNNNQLQEHKRARHGLGRIHSCAYCEYSSATKEALTIHERRHTGERPYICDHCGATFHRRSNLVQHIAIHLPERNFQCPKCPVREKSKKRLSIHNYNAHRDKKYMYICPVCQESYSRPGSVRNHLARAHNVPRADQGAILRIRVDLPLATGMPPQPALENNIYNDKMFPIPNV